MQSSGASSHLANRHPYRQRGGASTVSAGGPRGGDDGVPKKFIGGAERARRNARKRLREGGDDWAGRGGGGGGGGGGRWKGKRGCRGGGGKNGRSGRTGRNIAEARAEEDPMPSLPRSMKPHDRFFAALLSPSSSDAARSNADEPVRLALLSGMCGRVGLPPPSPLPATYRDARHFYSSRAALVVEEARWAVAEALSEGGRGRGKGGGGGGRRGGRKGEDGYLSSGGGEATTLRLVSAEDAPKSRAALLAFAKVGRDGRTGADAAAPAFSPTELRDMRPGCCFELTPKFPMFGAEVGKAGGERSVLAAVLPGAPDGGGGGGGRMRAVFLMVFRPRWRCRLLSAEPDKGGGVVGGGGNSIGDLWDVRPLTSLISEVRQFEACSRRPNVPFLPKLMGWKAGTHIRFADSDDDDDDDDDDEEKDEEEEKTEDDVVVAGRFDEENSRGDKSAALPFEGDDGDSACGSAARFRLPSLNPAQERAAAKFLDSPPSALTLVQGPPGTGKTTFLVSVLCRCLAAGRRVLVSAPTNRAVAVLAARFLDALVDRDSVNVALIGVEEKLLEVEAEAESGGGGGNSSSVSDASFASSSSSSSSSALRSVFVHTWLDSVAEECRSLREELLRLDDDPSGAPSDDDVSSDDGDNRRRTKAAAAAAALEGQLSRARSIRRRLDRSVPRLSRDSGASAAAGRVVASLERAVSAATVEGDETDSRLLLAVAEAREAMAVLVGALEGGEGADDGRGGAAGTAAAEELLGTADVVFGTLSAAGAAAVRRTGGVDDLLVDEAAAATEAEVCVPFHLRPGRMLAVGDPMQLPATILSKHAVACGLDKSLHERLVSVCGREHIMLDVQYRMRPAISAFPSRRFYGGNLTDGDNVKRCSYRENGAILEGAPYSFFQVKGTERRTRGGSYYNADEGEAVARLVGTIRASRNRSGRPAAGGAWNSPDRIRVITFYRGQVALLRTLLRRSGLGGVTVATVDSSQGCEADVVVVSFVRSNDRGRGDGDGDGGSGGGGGNDDNVRRAAGFLADDRRVNVALTRARYQLVCVGDALGTLRMSGGGTIGALVEDARRRGCVSALGRYEERIRSK